MNREKCINRNIAIASAIISCVNILTFIMHFISVLNLNT